jgi:DNA-binding NtrC family response regulator
MSWMKKILSLHPHVIVIFMTNHGDLSTAVQAIREGATDFIPKPLMKEKLLASLHSALRLHRSEAQVRQLNTRQGQLLNVLNGPQPKLVGSGPIMQKIKRDIAKVADTTASVLVLGENGTGKDLAAKEIHHLSARRHAAFISVDMGSLSDNLFESELFGHTKGAFTGADQERVGRFELADGGTIFLDEIGNLPLALQPKLLKVLQDGIVTRAGSNTPIPVDVRVISATNQPVYRMSEEGGFRQDLLFRLNTIEIQLPPLRERPQDLPLLLQHFMEKYGQKYNKKLSPPGARLLKRLSQYSWPGNIRELEHWVERTVIMSEGSKLDPEDAPTDSRSRQAHSPTTPESGLKGVELQTIEESLARHGGNVTRAAAELGLTRYSLYRRMEKLGIK